MIKSENIFMVMKLSPLEEHISELDKRREKVFLKSFMILSNSINRLKNYYLVTLSIGGVVVFLNYLSAYFNKNEIFFVTINFLVSFVVIFSLAKYLSLSEKEVEYYGNRLRKLGLKYYQEIKIIENFYAGNVNEKEIRKFYLKKEEDLFNKQVFSNKSREIISRWMVFVVLSVAVVLLLI